ncbi:DNA polymerase Y subunit UmuC family protein, partial [Streptomyces scabiei]|uniref:hypothetical protein n=1 Tax=Streptomyces scabiei TaxID=1930 RepID=UPI0038F79C6E
VASEANRTVVQCNASALRQGIKPGMGLADAWLISEGLLHQFYAAEREAALLNTLAAQLYNHFAEVAIDDTQRGIWL